LGRENIEENAAMSSFSARHIFDQYSLTSQSKQEELKQAVRSVSNTSTVLGEKFCRICFQGDRQQQSQTENTNAKLINQLDSCPQSLSGEVLNTVYEKEEILLK
jgi:hypothetical protein